AESGCGRRAGGPAGCKRQGSVLRIPASNGNRGRARPLRDTLDKGALLPVGKIVWRRLLAAAFDGDTSLREVVLPMPECERLPGGGTGILVRYITRKSEFDPCNPLYDNDNLAQVRVL